MPDQLREQHAGRHGNDGPGPRGVHEGNRDGGLGQAERPALPAEGQMDDGGLRRRDRDREQRHRVPRRVAPAIEHSTDHRHDNSCGGEQANPSGGGHPDGPQPSSDQELADHDEADHDDADHEDADHDDADHEDADQDEADQDEASHGTQAPPSQEFACHIAALNDASPVGSGGPRRRSHQPQPWWREPSIET